MVTGESLVDDVNTSLVYFEDRYGVGVDRLLVTGVQSAQALQAAFGEDAKSRWKNWFRAAWRRRCRQRHQIGSGRSRGGAGFLMRIHINLASQPYEAAREYRRRIGLLVAGAWRCSPCGLVGYILYQRSHRATSTGKSPR